ncbi:hypothetical protein AVEN_247989-1 [Araneus ventricosus]|uniref:Uncharacterized protein n=1 Tax=Araneus ventricosus TaxID=182803 RepID=A0A4Y2MX77_ARAVE|nr:hypothetical protein AVEN_247989-1 [Araneus ventricosus]
MLLSQAKPSSTRPLFGGLRNYTSKTIYRKVEERPITSEEGVKFLRLSGVESVPVCRQRKTCFCCRVCTNRNKSTQSDQKTGSTPAMPKHSDHLNDSRCNSSYTEAGILIARPRPNPSRRRNVLSLVKGPNDPPLIYPQGKRRPVNSRCCPRRGHTK